MTGRPAETMCLDLSLHRIVVEESAAWIAASPDREVGGKFAGRIHGSFDARAGDWRRQLAGIRIEVIHHLDAGPGARRTPTYHRPDGRYQESLFRAIEARHPDVRHLGSWHSHHPNGLGVLSQGDITGYRRDVNSPHHSHDLFVASLAVDGRGLARARHFLFVRGQRDFWEIDSSSVHVADGANAYAAIVSGYRDRADPARESGAGPGPPPPVNAAGPGPPPPVNAADPGSRPPASQADPEPPASRAGAEPPASRAGAEPTAGPTIFRWFRRLMMAVVRRAPGPEEHRNSHGKAGRPISSAESASSPASASSAGHAGTADQAEPPWRRAGAIPEWATRRAGQEALSADRAWLSAEHPDLRLVSRGGTLLWIGVVAYHEMTMAVTMAYPGDYPASPPVVDIAGAMPGLEVKVQAILRPDRPGDEYRRQLFRLMKRVYEIDKTARKRP